MTLRESLFCGNKKNWDQSQVLGDHDASRKKKWEKKGPSRVIIQKCELQERFPWAPKFEERTLDETLKQERCTRKAAWNLVEDVYKLKKRSHNLLLAEAWVVSAPSSTNPEERQFVIDSGASMHTLSKKDLSLGELDTFKRSRTSITVVTANGEVQTNEEAQVYVHDLHIFVPVQLLEDTPAVLSLGKLCKEHGHTHEWPNGSEPRLTKNGNQTFCRTRTSSHWSIHDHHRVQPQLLSRHRLRKICPISLDPATIRSHEEFTGHCNKEVAGNCSTGIPEWLVDFTENLEIVETPAAAENSHDSDPERPFKVASRKHSMYTHFPKDRNCEVCKRTKITRALCRRLTGETGTSGREIWWFDHSRSQSPQRRKRNLVTIIDAQSWCMI